MKTNRCNTETAHPEQGWVVRVPPDRDGAAWDAATCSLAPEGWDSQEHRYRSHATPRLMWGQMVQRPGTSAASAKLWRLSYADPQLRAVHTGGALKLRGEGGACSSCR